MYYARNTRNQMKILPYEAGIATVNLGVISLLLVLGVWDLFIGLGLCISAIYLVGYILQEVSGD